MSVYIFESNYFAVYGINTVKSNSTDNIKPRTQLWGKKSNSEKALKVDVCNMLVTNARLQLYHYKTVRSDIYSLAIYLIDKNSLYRRWQHFYAGDEAFL